MRIKNKLTMTVSFQPRTTDELSGDDLKQLTDFFMILIEIDQRNKKSKKELIKKLCSILLSYRNINLLRFSVKE